MVRRVKSFENVYGVDMSYVIWYSCLEAVLSGTVSGGVVQLVYFHSYRYVMIVWWSAAVL
jgi:hypothetical protein